jgi:hypothetical protein
MATGMGENPSAVTAIKHQPTLPDLPIRRVEEMGLKELERIR